ncbi:MAG: transglutaminase-like domain-containing protein [Clostridia bacterium]|nr:transglutaminase-like domain-containing protein [Clostridia bacterium]
MSELLDLNYITIAIVIIFIIPVLSGIFDPFSRERVLYTVESILNNIQLILGVFLSIYVTKKIFFEHDGSIFNRIYEWIPESFRVILYGKDILTYLAVVPLILIVVLAILRLLTVPLYRAVLEPFASRLYVLLSSMNGVMRRILGVLWRLPKAIIIVLLFSLMLNFYAYYFSTPSLSKLLNESGTYQFLYKNALYPVLNSNIAKEIPVLVSDSFRQSAEDLFSKVRGQESIPLPPQLTKQLNKRNIKVIEYFNGVTLDEAIKSTPEIDRTAREIVGSEKNSKKKAYLLYKWISQNVKYDYDKAASISSNPKGISSGSVVAYKTKKGICFDYSSLYVSMCRAVGLKVRLVTGLGYSGMTWGDHAWNQVYSSEENRWINVDTTFGSISNYFDKSDFSVDHKYDEVQGEW